MPNDTLVNVYIDLMVFTHILLVLHRQYVVDIGVNTSDFIWDFGKLPFPAHLGKYIIKNGKISTKIHEIGKIKSIFGLGMTPI